MRVPLALLADHATAHPTDGRLYVTGGGIATLPFPAFPAIQPHLSLALGIEVAPHELGIEHALSIDSFGPNGEAITRPIKVTFSVPPGRDPSLPSYFHFVSNMDDISFPAEGEYTFLVAIDSKQLNQITVRAEGSADAKLAAEANARQEAEKLLNDGYRAFSGGDSSAAEAAFRVVTERFPTMGAGHNNLGFMLLANGDASAALQAFARANELGYWQREIGDANVACALYLSGDPAAALHGFVNCLQRHVFTTPATLFGIGPLDLFPVQLGSAAEYASLISLNAGWSALGAGDASAASIYWAGARAGVLSQRSDESGQRFAESVNALDAKIRQRPRRASDKTGSRSSPG